MQQERDLAHASRMTSCTCFKNDILHIAAIQFMMQARRQLNKAKTFQNPLLYHMSFFNVSHALVNQIVFGEPPTNRDLTMLI